MGFAGGLALAVVIALVAAAGAPLLPLAGAPVLAIVIGAGLATLVTFPPSLRTGFTFAARFVLQAAVVVSGFGLSLGLVATTGVKTLPVAIGTIAVALILAPIAGRALGVDGVVRQLIGVGTAICGASAIAAVSAVIVPDEAEMAMSIATIFAYNIIAVLTFPAIGHLLGLSADAFGTWAGTAINDTSSVVAAGYAYGPAAGEHATIVKLTRATFILPIVAFIAIARARSAASAGVRVPWLHIIPWFIVVFVAAACVNSTGIVPANWHPGITATSTFLISIALAAIGMQTNIRGLARTGARPLALGFMLWVSVAVASLCLQHLTGS